MTDKKRLDLLFSDDATLRTLKKPAGLDPEVRSFLLDGMHEMATRRRHGNKVNGKNAGEKGSVWRQAAIEQYNERRHEYKSLPDFCGDIAETMRETADGQKQVAPKYDQVYRTMLDARKKGEI